MEASLKAKWIKALRSGKYKQGRQVLRSLDDRFCCLGVLCDIGGLGEWKKLDNREYVYAQGEVSPACFLPLPTKYSASMKKGQYVLMSMNDVDKLSFNEIADWIEANIKEDQ